METESKKTEAEKLKSLIFDKKYVYNKEDDAYVVFLKSLSKNIVVDGKSHRDMQQSYCDDVEVDEICFNHSMPKTIFDEYKKIFGWTRKGFPLSDEKVESETLEESVDSLIQMKKFEIKQEANKKNWKETVEDARKWKEFFHENINPYENALKKINFNIPAKKIPKIKKRKGASYALVMTDWHIGAKLSKTHSFRDDVWDIEHFNIFFDKFVEYNVNKIKELKPQISDITILSLGDILDGLRGKTEKGTELEQELDREDQFNLGFEKVIQLIKTISKLGVPLKIVSIKGNHDGLDNYNLFKAIEQVFKNDVNIKFENHTKRCAFVEFPNKSLFLVDHGAHDIMNAKVPSGKAPREAYIQSMFMTRPDLIQKYPNRYFVQGDQHHNEWVEFNDFTFIMVSSPAKSLYSDANNWNSRPSQMSFLIDEKGISEVYKFYFD